MSNYPNDSLQAFTNSWWVDTKPKNLEKGCLIWAYLPHVSQVLNILSPEGRSSATDHTQAKYKIEPLTKEKMHSRPSLPVAALPSISDGVYTVYKAKRRPALVLCCNEAEVPKELRTGGAKWQTTKTILVAPYYGVAQSGSRGGWNSELVSRIRKCEYPQYMWDKLPCSNNDEESVLRFDHIQPIGADHKSIEMTAFTLSKEAISFIDEWLYWFMHGRFHEDGNLHEIRKELLT